MSDSTDFPKHVGIIMDGNRRWAKAKGLPTLKGHLQGQQTLRGIAQHAFRRGVEYLSVYAFSTENWRRTEEEIGYLMSQVARSLKKYVPEFVDAGVRIRFLGVREGLPSSVLQAIENAEAQTAANDKATLAICFNYGGQQEIVDATKALIAAGTLAEEITSETFAEHLYAPDIPPIDLLIRSSGEQRISNFMLWRSAYSELVFTETFWPDFTPEEFDAIVRQYAERQRRFGK